MLDMMMPGMDGITMAAMPSKSRTRPSPQSIPGDAYTSMEINAEVQEARQAGMMDFLSKPVRQSRGFATVAASAALEPLRRARPYTHSRSPRQPWA